MDKKSGRIYLDLKTVEEARLFIKPERYFEIKKELIDFLEGEKHLNTKSFAKKVMFSHEIKANNQVEGYGDDIDIIRQVIKKVEKIKDQEKRKRILNLYHGYNYILKNKDIDIETLRKLYNILSKDLIELDLLPKMGEYYRQAPVYILKRGRLDETAYQGVPYQDIDKYIDMYFEFLNQEIEGDITDEYIKTQILHYYFVYIHPYFDVNGRTSRTLSMWQLLNKKAYPYIIFNRGISFKDREYDKVIEDVRKFNDLTFFVNYMLNTVKLELEKEYVMQVLASTSNSKLEAVDYQTLLYYLTMKGEKTVLDFVTLYNRFNDKKNPKEIYETMIVSLLDKGIIDIVRSTKKNISSDLPNVALKLRKTDDISTDKVKRLVLR